MVVGSSNGQMAENIGEIIRVESSMATGNMCGQMAESTLGNGRTGNNMGMMFTSRHTTKGPKVDGHTGSKKDYCSTGKIFAL